MDGGRKKILINYYTREVGENRVVVDERLSFSSSLIGMIPKT